MDLLDGEDDEPYLEPVTSKEHGDGNTEKLRHCRGCRNTATVFRGSHLNDCLGGSKDILLSVQLFRRCIVKVIDGYVWIRVKHAALKGETIPVP